jgi:threonine/homoserine/homoserine lactone efflux protein
MDPTEPQFLYMILVLPTLFGLILIGEGLNKVLKDEIQGWFSIIFGILFIGVVIFAYWFFASNL